MRNGYSYRDALRLALREREADLKVLHRGWTEELERALDRTEAVAKAKLNPAHFEAVRLQIEMQRDLLPYLPDPTRVPDDGEGRLTSPDEPQRVMRELQATERFVEWLLFRKYRAGPRELATLFDRSRLRRRFRRLLCRGLRELEGAVDRLMRTPPPVDGSDRRSVRRAFQRSGLKVVERPPES